jgi:hypothetical protein
MHVQVKRNYLPSSPPPLPVSMSSTVPFTVSVYFAVFLAEYVAIAVNIPFPFAIAVAISISVTVAMSVAFADAILVAVALSSSTPVPIAVFLPSLYVAPTR